jgi:hypothetical protein
MRTPRRPPRPRAPRVPRVRTGAATFRTTALAIGAGASGDSDLHAAAMIIADDASDRAMRWAKTGSVPASRSVDGDEQMQTITFSAGAAYPAEMRAKHPLFGDRRHWYGPPGEPFLLPALEARADDATERYAQVTDKIAMDNGWEPG